MRSSGATRSGPPGAVTRFTKSRIACLAGPSFQEGSGGGLAAAERRGRPTTPDAATADKATPRLRRVIESVLSSTERPSPPVPGFVLEVPCDPRPSVAALGDLP